MEMGIQAFDNMQTLSLKGKPGLIKNFGEHI